MVDDDFFGSLLSSCWCSDGLDFCDVDLLLLLLVCGSFTNADWYVIDFDGLDLDFVMCCIDDFSVIWYRPDDSPKDCLCPCNDEKSFVRSNDIGSLRDVFSMDEEGIVFNLSCPI